VKHADFSLSGLGTTQQVADGTHQNFLPITKEIADRFQTLTEMLEHPFQFSMRGDLSGGMRNMGWWGVFLTVDVPLVAANGDSLSQVESGIGGRSRNENLAVAAVDFFQSQTVGFGAKYQSDRSLRGSLAESRHEMAGWGNTPPALQSRSFGGGGQGVNAISQGCA
jgi:hypothetical protein